MRREPFDPRCFSHAPDHPHPHHYAVSQDVRLCVDRARAAVTAKADFCVLQCNRWSMVDAGDGKREMKPEDSTSHLE